jgi:O-antigen/teichoic acid export membrane protein
MRQGEREPLATTAARGVGILVSRTLVLQLLTAGVTLVLARLLSPADYGLFALAAAVQSVAQVASGAGLSAALIRQPDDPTPQQQRAVSGFLFSTGLAFAALTAAIALAGLPAAGVRAEALGVIAVTALAVPLYALRAVPMVLLERHLRFGRVAVVETAETLAFNAFALLGAIAGLGAYSLAGGVPAAAAAGLLVVRSLHRPGPGLSFDLGVVRPLAHFGLRASALQGLNLVRGLGFVTLITAIAGPATAGFYGMASRLFAFPTALASAVQRVSFPALSRSLQERPRRAARAATLSAVVASLPLALLAGTSHTLVTVLLGERWLPTVDLVLASSPGILLGASAIPAMVGLALSQGRPNGPIAAVAASALAMLGFGAIAVPALDSAGVGLAMTIGAAVNVAVLAVHTERATRSATGQVVWALVIGAIAVAAGYLPPLPETLLGLAARIALVAAAWTGLALWLMRPVLTDALQVAQPMVPPRLRRLATWRPGTGIRRPSPPS